jgi:uncharacterized protein YecT (DUF1311 family)
MRNVIFSTLFIVSCYPAYALDCRAAKSAVEKAICSDAESHEADDALGRAYSHLRESLSDDQKAGLRSSQVKWIADRDQICLGPRAIQPLAKCVAQQSKGRQRFLEGKPIAGDVDANLFQPLFVFRRARNGSARLAIETIKFVGDGTLQASLNAKIDKLVKDAIADAEGAADGRPPARDEDFHVEQGADLTYASSRLVSMLVTYENYLGQVHPYHWETNVNYDVAKERELKFDDLLSEAAAKNVFALCQAQISKEKMIREAEDGIKNPKDDIDPEEVASRTKELSAWKFQASSVLISYDADAFGGYGECMCDCSLPYATLRTIAKKDFPLP